MAEPEPIAAAEAGTSEAGTSERPVAVVDIGSNSVRLIVYEAARRGAVPLFNEKVLCGLGRQVARKGRLGEKSVARALAALKRFRAIAGRLDSLPLHVVATAAAREAANGAAFIARAEEICGAPIRVLSGGEEAALAATGVIAGIPDADGLAGDLGGGSLELIDIADGDLKESATLPLGGLRLIEASGGDIKEARQIVDQALDRLHWLAAGAGRAFYLVGGTWRAFAKVHMAWRDYPLRVLHQYAMAPSEVAVLAHNITELPLEFFSGAGLISKARQETLPFGALVLERLVRRLEPTVVVVSAFGVREGLHYELLPAAERARDPLLAACEDLARLRARSPAHARELVHWTDQIFAGAGPDESEEERRLRHAACLISDVGWRMHPEYRGVQSVNLIEKSGFAGITHPGRAYLSLAVYYRHEGLGARAMEKRLKGLAGERLLKRARILGAAIRTAHMISIGQPGMIERAKLEYAGDRLLMRLDRRAADFDGERLRRRFRVLARELGREGQVVIEGAGG